MTEPFSKVVRDPVHGLVSLKGEEGRLILSLVDTPEFQRLRRIRQLGLSFLTYPGAEHSRWTHSFGVANVARRMLDALTDCHRPGDERIKELEANRKEILVAALLHDLGHGPFSHVFESVSPRPRGIEGYPRNHEEWTLRIIRDRLKGKIKEHGVDVAVVCDLIENATERYVLSKDIISSQLDADRMDYLLRDSAATGRGSGRFDLDWMLNSLRIGKAAAPEGAERWRLCVDARKGIQTLEEFVMARQFMYVQVYFHKTTRAYEAMLRHIFMLAEKITDGDPNNAPQPCPGFLAKLLAREPLETSDYLKLDDHRLWTIFHDWASGLKKRGRLGRLLREKCERLVHRGRPYRTIELDESDRRKMALELKGKLEDSSLRFSFFLDECGDTPYKRITYRSGKEGEEEEDFTIKILNKRGRVDFAETKSRLLDGLPEIEIARLYYDDEDERIESALAKAGLLEKTGEKENVIRKGTRI